MLFLKGHLETFRFWSCQKERKPLDQNPNYSLHFFFACLIGKNTWTQMMLIKTVLWRGCSYLIIRAPLRGCTIVVSLSVCPRSLARGISSLPLAHSGLYFTHRLPLGKCCEVTLNHFYRLKDRVLAELYIKFLSRHTYLSFFRAYKF